MPSGLRDWPIAKRFPAGCYWRLKGLAGRVESSRCGTGRAPSDQAISPLSGDETSCLRARKTCFLSVKSPHRGDTLMSARKARDEDNTRFTLWLPTATTEQLERLQQKHGKGSLA